MLPHPFLETMVSDCLATDDLVTGDLDKPFLPKGYILSLLDEGKTFYFPFFSKKG